MRSSAVLLLLVIAVSVPMTLAGEPKLNITPISYSQDGELSLSVRWDASEQITIWAWRGTIYPLLGLCLTASVTSLDGRALDVENVELVEPKFPTQLQAVRSSSFTYAEPLRLRVLQADGSAYRGCLEIQLHYDLSGKCRRTFERHGFTILSVKSNLAAACNSAG